MIPDWLKAAVLTPVGFVFFALLGLAQVIRERAS